MHAVASVHAPPSPPTAFAPPAPSVSWGEDDQALLAILLSDDVKTDAVFSPPSSDAQVQQQVQPASPVEYTPACADTPPKKTSPKAKGKLTAVERRARHREVVKRAYHRNKAALKSLRDTVKSLEGQLERLTLQNGKPTAPDNSDVQRRYQLLTTEQSHLDQEAARLRLLLNYRQQFAASMVTLAQRAASISDDSDNSDTDSDISTLASSTSSLLTSSPSTASTTSVDMDVDMDTFGLSQATPGSSFYKEPHPTLLGPNVSPKVPLAVAMRKQVGYKPLAFQESTQLVNETYRAILNFSLSGRALSSGASVMGWEDRRLLDGTTLKFSLRKSFPGENALRLMASTWQCLSDPECTETRFRGLMTLRVLQRVNDDTIVAMRDTRSEDDSKIYRCVYILFRVRTRRGFLVCIQSIAPERLTDPSLNSFSRDGKTVHWVDMACWFVFEHSHDFEEGGAQVEYGGSMDNGDVESVRTLAVNTLSIVLKWESTMVAPLFSLPASS